MMGTSIRSRAAQPFRRIKPSHIPGYIVIVVFASLSAFALSFIAFRALWLLVSPLFKRSSNDRVISKEQIFFRTQLGHYAICLLISNVFTSVAGVVVSVWVAMDGIHREEEWLCTVQAILMQIGNFATAYFTVAVAFHTINSFVFHLNQTAWVGATVMTMGWVTSIFMGVIPLKISSSKSGSAYGFDGFSCGIKDSFPVSNFLLHLLPIFIAAVASVVIYSLIFLSLRGTLVVKGGLKIILDPEQRREFDQYHLFISSIAKTMLWYPFAYNLLLLPYSITKLLELSGYEVAFGGNVFAYTCSFMLGLVNVCLLYNTFRVLEPAFEARCNTFDMQKTDLERFGDSSRIILPCSAVEPASQNADKPTPVRAYSDSFLPSWDPSTSDRASSSWTQTSTYQNSISHLSTDSPTDSLMPDDYEKHYGSPSHDLPVADSTAGPILSTPDFKNILIAAPEPVLQKKNVGASDTRLELNYQYISSAYYASPSIGLPIPPQCKRVPLLHNGNNGTATLQSLDTESPDVDIRSGSVPSRESSITSVTDQDRDTFGWPSRHTPNFGSLIIETSSMLDLHNALDLLTSDTTPEPTPPIVLSRSINYDEDNYEMLSTSNAFVTASARNRSLPEVPRNVDSNDFGSVPTSARRTSDTIREEFYSSMGTTTLGGLSPFAWATGTDVTTSGSSRGAHHYDHDGSISLITEIIQPRLSAPTLSPQIGTIPATRSRQSLESIGSMMPGRLHANMEDDSPKHLSSPFPYV